VEHALDVHASQRGRDEAEVGEHRVAPADIRVVLEHVAEATLARKLPERAAGVGDRAEARAVAAAALEEVAHVRERLDGAA
jgi:hypothetical protein